MGCLGPGAFRSRRRWFSDDATNHFTVSRYAFRPSTFIISKNAAAGGNLCKDRPPLALMSSPSVGFFRAVAQDLLPEKSRPEAGLENSHRRREEV
jgi:hypothetical protein